MHTEKQLEIINKATLLIASKGYSNFTTKNLAAEMGFSEPALYRHFKNKQAILLGVMNYFEYLASEKIVSKTSAKGMQKLEEFVLNRLQFFAQNPMLTKVMLYDSDFRSDELLYSKAKSIMQKHMQRLKQAIAEGKKANEFKPELSEEHIFYIVIGATRLLSTRWIMHNCKFDLFSEGKKLFESIKRII